MLAAGRDGQNYDLPCGFERFLPLGEAGTWNGEIVNVSMNPPIRNDPRLYIYYTARNSAQYAVGPASNYLGLASLAVDRFVGITAGDHGFVLTEPIAVNAPYLYINMQNTYGWVQVEVRDESNHVIGGYEIDNCPKMQERRPAVRVQWRDKKDLRELVGRRCTFKFLISNATLYSYRFSDE